MANLISSIFQFRKNLPLPIRMGYGWMKRMVAPHPIWDNTEFKRYYQWLQETQWWSREQLEVLQLEQLQALVKHAYENVPYYRRLFDELHLKPSDISTLIDLQEIPVLTKEDIRNNLDDLIARNIDQDNLNYVTTGGSTGRPLGLYHDKDTAVPREASFRLRQWSWAGYQRGDRIVTLRGNLISRLEKGDKRAWWDYNTEDNELVLSSFDMSEENMRRYIEKIREFKPRFIHAFPSSLEILARFMKRNGFSESTLIAVFLESEILYPWQRQLIESQFGCEVYSGYGHTERAVDATECEQHAGYHISMEYGILELVDKEREPIEQPGILGRVLGTGFDTYCMPLIRYVTDDLAVLASGNCGCQRQSTLIQDFKGRIREFVVSSKGHLVSLSSLNMHEPIGGKIREIKFIQEREGELLVEIAKVSSFPEKNVAQEFLEEVYRRLDEKEFYVKINFVDHVTRTQRGKVGLLEQKLDIQPEDLPLSLTNYETAEIATNRFQEELRS